MGDEDHRALEHAPKRQQVVVEPEAGDLVERGERLVHQQQPRLGHQRARDRDAHLHAAGQFARIGRREIGKTDARRAPAPPPRAFWSRRRAASRSGSRTFCATFAHGISVGSWNTKPICRRRLFRPPIRPCRRTALLRPAMMRSAVDLPQPEGPSSDTNSPSRTARSKPCSATVPRSNVLPTPRSETTRGSRRDHFGLNSTPTPLLTNCSV